MPWRAACGSRHPARDGRPPAPETDGCQRRSQGTACGPQAQTDPQNFRNKSAPVQAPAINCKSGPLNPVPDRHTLHQRRRHQPRVRAATAACRAGQTCMLYFVILAPILTFVVSAGPLVLRSLLWTEWPVLKASRSGAAPYENGMPENGMPQAAFVRRQSPCRTGIRHLCLPGTCDNVLAYIYIYIYIERQGLKPEHCQGTSSLGTNTCAIMHRPGSDKLCRRACLHFATGRQGIYKS